METIVKKYRDRIWQVAAGESIGCAFYKDLKAVENELNAFAIELIGTCDACMSQPAE